MHPSFHPADNCKDPDYRGLVVIRGLAIMRCCRLGGPRGNYLSPRAANGLDPLPPDVRWPAVGFDRQVYGIEIDFA